MSSSYVGVESIFPDSNIETKVTIGELDLSPTYCDANWWASDAFKESSKTKASEWPPGG